MYNKQQIHSPILFAAHYITEAEPQMISIISCIYILSALNTFRPPCGKTVKSKDLNFRIFIQRILNKLLKIALDCSQRLNIQQWKTKSCPFSGNPLWHFIPLLSYLGEKSDLIMYASFPDKTSPFKRFFHEIFIVQSLKFNDMGKCEWNLYVISSNYFF